MELVINKIIGLRTRYIPRFHLIVSAVILFCGCSESVEIQWLVPSDKLCVDRVSIINYGFERVNVDVPMYEKKLDEGVLSIQFSDIEGGTCLYQMWAVKERITHIDDLDEYLVKNGLTKINESVMRGESLYVMHDKARTIYRVLITELGDILFIYEFPRVVDDEWSEIIELRAKVPRWAEVFIQN